VKLSPKCHSSGTTLVEVLVATLLLASFFASLFEANAVCLRFIAASKQPVAAIEAVQARAEVFRSLAFSNLISASYVQNSVLKNPLDGSVNRANASDFVKSATEVVKISAYPTDPAKGVTQMTLNPNGAVTLDSTATSLGSTLVKVDISQTWTGVLGGRQRTEQTSLIISNGTKK
jgi:Tfp pilus assembly protein PilV